MQLAQWTVYLGRPLSRNSAELNSDTFLADTGQWKELFLLRVWDWEIINVKFEKKISQTWVKKESNKGSQNIIIIMLSYCVIFINFFSSLFCCIVLQLWTFRESVSSPKCLIFLRQHMVSGLRKNWVPSSDVVSNSANLLTIFQLGTQVRFNSLYMHYSKLHRHLGDGKPPRPAPSWWTSRQYCTEEDTSAWHYCDCLKASHHWCHVG